MTGHPFVADPQHPDVCADCALALDAAAHYVEQYRDVGRYVWTTIVNDTAHKGQPEAPPGTVAEFMAGAVARAADEGKAWRYLGPRSDTWYEIVILAGAAHVVYVRVNAGRLVILAVADIDLDNPG